MDTDLVVYITSVIERRVELQDAPVCRAKFDGRALLGLTAACGARSLMGTPTGSPHKRPVRS